MAIAPPPQEINNWPSAQAGNIDVIGQPPILEIEGIDRQSIEEQARLLIENRADFPSPEVSFGERQDNARTLLMEALTASAHESIVEIPGESVEQLNGMVLARLLNGWDESLPQHEQDRRFAEICNELIIGKTHQAIADGLIDENTAVAEISDYPAELSADRATKLGYRYKNMKGMIRSSSLRKNPNGTYTRIIQQVSRSNGTGQSTKRFFEIRGVELGNKPDLQALSTPLIYSINEFPLGATDITRELDSYSGPNTLYGDTGLARETHPDYRDLADVSKDREKYIVGFVNGLANLQSQIDQMLTAGQITSKEHKSIFGEEIDRILSAVCTVAPEYAKDTFGESTVEHFYRISDLVAGGRIEEAAQELARANLVKEMIIFCGGSISVEQAQRMGLGVNGTVEHIKQAKENWEIKYTMCRIKGCPTRPDKTECGPCNICIEKCQPIFNKGQTPSWLTWGTSTADAVISFAVPESGREKLKLSPYSTTTAK